MTDVKTLMEHAHETLSHVKLSDIFSTVDLVNHQEDDQENHIPFDSEVRGIHAVKALPASVHDALGRPTPPPYERRILYIGALIGLALAVFLMMYVYSSYMSYQTRSAAEATATVASAAAQKAVKATPIVSSLFQVTDSALKQSYSSSTTYDTSVTGASTSFAVLGSNVKTETLKAFLTSGGGDAAAARDVLLGTIFLQTSAGTDGEHHTCTLEYADYYSASVQACIDLTLSTQKLTSSADSSVITISTNVTSSDGSSSGTLTLAGTTEYWTVTIAPLTSIYTIADDSTAYAVTVFMTNEVPLA